jgi:pimeloyl-ACP methyl ester carboxylesterase
MPNADGSDYKSIWMWLKEVPFRQQYVVSNGIRTRVATAGDPKNPAVTLLHGTGGHWEAYAPILGALAQDYFVIAPDYVGCGFTDKPRTPWTIKTYQDHVLGLLDHFGVTKSTFFGMSLGAWIAGSLGRDYPERTSKLVLMSPAGVLVKTGNMERIRRERTQAVEGADWASIKVLFDHLIASEDNKIDDIIATRLAIYKRQDTRETIDSMLYLQQPGIQEDNLVTEEQWKALQAPTLLTHAGKDVEDFKSASQQLEKWIPNVESFQMPEVAHWPSFEDPETFNPAALKFLSGGGA